MLVTVEHVVAVLHRSGRPVTERTLRDWVGKRLLPPRRRVGRGRGQGVTWGWTDPGIVRQVAIVNDLLAWHGRVATAWLPLWVLGYDVPVEAVREQLLAFLDGFLDATTGNAGDEEVARDRAYDFAAQMVRSRRATFPSVMTEALLAQFLDALVNHVFDPQQQTLDYVAEDWRAFVARNMAHASSASLKVDGGTVGDAVAMLTSVRRVSVHRLREAVATASPVAFREVQQFLNQGVEVMRRLVRATPEGRAVASTLIAAPWRGLALLGLYAGPVLLLAVREEPTWWEAMAGILVMMVRAVAHVRE